MTETQGFRFELAEHLGMRGLDLGDGRCRWAMTLQPIHMNPVGVVHGGMLYTLVDYAMGGALYSTLAPGQSCTTLEIKMHYLAPATDGDVQAEAWVVNRGARIAVLEGRVTLGETLLAIATGTFYIMAANRPG